MIGKVRSMNDEVRIGLLDRLQGWTSEQIMTRTNERIDGLTLSRREEVRAVNKPGQGELGPVKAARGDIGLHHSHFPRFRAIPGNSGSNKFFCEVPGAPCPPRRRSLVFLVKQALGSTDVDPGITGDNLGGRGMVSEQRVYMIQTARMAWRIVLAALFTVCFVARISAGEQTKIPASDARFRYEGRFDFASTNGPVVIWQASRITFGFSGNAIGLLFDGAKGQNFFNAAVDGSNSVVEIRDEAGAQTFKLSGFGNGRHHLALFKRSEASAGTVEFCGVELMSAAMLWSSEAPGYKLRMEFIGDSITVGACNEDGAEDQWNSRRTHNAALSYARLTADAFLADHRNIAVSGMGIAAGWVDVRAGEVWDKVYPNPLSPGADLAQWTPNVVFVNLGENDDSFPRAHGQPFPTNYTSGYVSLVRAIRGARPNARIVLLRGGMFGGAQSPALREAWESAVTQLETGDKKISHFVFKHWTKTHPRVADDQSMANELIAWLKQQQFMLP
jgi:lysophospholipase L1-like esterase